jgi:hypothetical protein
VLTRYMDGRKDGRTDRVIPIYPPNFVCGGYIKLLNSYICHSGCPNYCNCLFLFLGRFEEGEGWFEIDST